MWITTKKSTLLLVLCTQNYYHPYSNVLKTKICPCHSAPTAVLPPQIFKTTPRSASHSDSITSRLCTDSSIGKFRTTAQQKIIQNGKFSALSMFLSFVIYVDLLVFFSSLKLALICNFEVFTIDLLINTEPKQLLVQCIFEIFLFKNCSIDKLNCKP